MPLIHGAAGWRPENSAPAEPQLIGCWITRQWSNGLTIDQRSPDWIDDTELPALAMGAGLASIAVARQHTDTEVSVCGYLVDTYCQGVKNAVPPNMLDRRDLPAFLADFFAAYHTDISPAAVPVACPIAFAFDLGIEARSDVPVPPLVGVLVDQRGPRSWKWNWGDHSRNGLGPSIRALEAARRVRLDGAQDAHQIRHRASLTEELTRQVWHGE